MNGFRFQRGISIWELLFFSALLVGSGIVVIKLLPLYMERFKVEKAMETIAGESDVKNLEERDIVNRLLRHFEIEDVDRFSRPEDLKKVFNVAKNKDNAGRTMTFKYEIRGEFLGDLDAVLKVNKTVPIAAYAAQ
jgi:hypothetical protein